MANCLYCAFRRHGLFYVSFLFFAVAHHSFKDTMFICPPKDVLLCVLIHNSLCMLGYVQKGLNMFPTYCTSFLVNWKIQKPSGHNTQLSPNNISRCYRWDGSNIGSSVRKRVFESRCFTWKETNYVAAPDGLKRTMLFGFFESWARRENNTPFHVNKHRFYWSRPNIDMVCIYLIRMNSTTAKYIFNYHKMFIKLKGTDAGIYKWSVDHLIGMIMSPTETCMLLLSI